MLNVPVKNIMQTENALLLPPATSVVAAAVQMAARHVGAVMVVEQGELLGIFTERDLMCRVVAKGLDPKVIQIAAVVDDGKLMGIISARNAMDPDLEEFVAETNRRVAMRE